jgi:hypothetical protein
MMNEANNNAAAAIMHTLNQPMEQAIKQAIKQSAREFGPLESQYRLPIQHRINTRKQVAHALCTQLDLSLVQHVLHLRSDHQYAP